MSDEFLRQLLILRKQHNILLPQKLFEQNWMPDTDEISIQEKRTKFLITARKSI